MAAKPNKTWSGFFLIPMLFGMTSPAQTQTQPDPELRRLLIEAANDSSSFEDRFDAEVWLTDMSGRLARKVPDARERLQLLKQIHFEATRKDLHPELVLAVIDIESNFDRFAISSAGAIGLMQVMPFWLKEIGRLERKMAI